jgi:hypothetical protein
MSTYSLKLPSKRLDIATTQTKLAARAVVLVLLVLGFGIRAFHTDETGARCPASCPTASRRRLRG